MIEHIIIAALSHNQYVVRPGDTLYAIAGKVYGNPDKWPELCRLNDIRDCDLIYPGQSLMLKDPPATLISYTGRHRGDNDNDSINPASYKPRHTNGAIHGNLGCNGLESLWIDNGGNPSKAFIAAEIAMAESGGNQFATGAAGERGYWQINPDHGGLSTYNANGNAKAAIVISGDGTNWTPWTTYTSGAYVGRC